MAKVAGGHGWFGDTAYEEILDLCRGVPDYEQAARDDNWNAAEDLLDGAIKEHNTPQLLALHEAIVGQAVDDDSEGLPVDEIGAKLREQNTSTFLKLTESLGEWHVEDSHAESWEDLCNDERIEPTEPEVFEHWIVTEWAKRKLAEHDERVGDVEGMTIWGRCTTGQAIALDRVWHAIAAEMQILQGQANDWLPKRR